MENPNLILSHKFGKYALIFSFVLLKYRVSFVMFQLLYSLPGLHHNLNSFPYRMNSTSQVLDNKALKNPMYQKSELLEALFFYQRYNFLYTLSIKKPKFDF